MLSYDRGSVVCGTRRITILGTISFLTIVAASGCGNQPTTMQSSDGQGPLNMTGTGSLQDPDRETLPSTVVEEEEDQAFDDFKIEAVALDSASMEWDLAVTSSRRRDTEFTFIWDFGDGETQTGPTQQHTYDEAGSYVVTVTALRNNGSTAFVLELELDIPELNNPPIVDAGEDQTVSEGDTVLVSAETSFDPEGDPLNFAWIQQVGPAVDLVNADQVTANFVAPEVDADTDLVFTVTVNDGENVAESSVVVIVQDTIGQASTGPEVNAGPDQTVVEFTSVTLDGTATTSEDSAPMAFEWFQMAGPTVSLSDPNSPTTAFEAPAADPDPSQLEFELVVSQGDVSSSDNVVILVTGNPNGNDNGSDPDDGDTGGGPGGGTDLCPNDPAKTDPGVCGCSSPDTDSDGDGTEDCVDGCPADANKTAPGDCGCGVPDIDINGDGASDCADACPNDPDKNAPGICGCGVPDDDSDGDGTADCNDGCPNDVNKATPGACGCGVSDVDSDVDGTPDCNDGCPSDANKTNPGSCGCGTSDVDTDADGTPNCNDGCPNDPNKTSSGACGCGVSDVDSDDDGVPDCNDDCSGTADTDNDGTVDCDDGCPNDANKTAPGSCGCGVADVDSDGDGALDCEDACPNDPNKVLPGNCGCGVNDADSDGDGVSNCNDLCPADPDKTSPGYCGCGVADDDSDGDGAVNCLDGCPNDPFKINPGVCGCGFDDVDSDGDGVVDCNDPCTGGPDSDGDGVADCEDGCPLDANKTAPGTCGCGLSDVDSDFDGVADCNDGCPADPFKTIPGLCGCGVSDADSDGDGVANCNDGCPADANKTAPGACGCGVSDTDSDGDGTHDCNDDCPNDPNKISEGICGCGTPDTDSDGDGAANCVDGCPSDANKTSPGACGCGVPDTDSDVDGTPNCNDGCPNDANKTNPGACGCGVSDVDSDGDGTPNCNDNCPNDPNKTGAGACGCGVSDVDSDGDGTPDCNDGCPNDANKTAPGACGCGVTDSDSDGDGTPNCNDGCPNDPFKISAGACGCGTADTDSDGDGTANCNDQCPNDPAKTAPGACGCGTSDADSDGDGTANCNDGCPNDAAKTAPGTCGCGASDADSDGDGTPNCNDGCPNDANKTSPGTCGCGVADTDSDGDGVPNCNDQCPGHDDSIDTDGNGVPDGCDGGGGSVYFEDFESLPTGSDPPNWMDTAADNSLQENDALFEVMSIGGGKAIGTTSAATNIHSHYVGSASDSWADFEFSGRIRISDAAGGVGITFLSSFADSDQYYRLRRGSFPGGEDFHVSPHGTNITGGITSTGIVPAANTWYRFRVEVQDTGTRTDIRAKVWADGSSEPGNWQIDCWDSSGSRLTQGRIGTWSMGSGGKYWDELRVDGVDCEADSDGDGTADCADGCPNDANKTSAGACGCGVAETDSDGDGVPNCVDQCPGAPDVDTDGDGVMDCDDDCPNDPDKSTPGQCGCGVSDQDSDGDGTPDCQEPPTLCVNPTSLNFGASTTNINFSVWNCGTGSLAYSISDNANWLSVSPSSGTSSGEQDAITASVNRAGLPDNSYQAEITVTPSIGAAITVLVSMSVGTTGLPMTTASVTSGTAPLPVFFEAVEPGHGVVQPSDGHYASQRYTWDFGDPQSGNWTTNGKSRNSATGFTAAHVYQYPGQYNVQLTVVDTGGQTHTYQQTINVSAFTGTTYYVSTSGSDSNNGSQSSPFKTIGKGLSVLGSGGKRLLLKRGDSFSRSSPIGVPSNTLLGAYGSGNRPRMNYSGSNDFFPLVNKSNVTVSGIHIVNSNGSAYAFSSWNATTLLFNDIALEGGKGLGTVYGDRIFVQDSTVRDSQLNNLFADCSRLSLLGNFFERAHQSHNLYLGVHRAVITANTVSAPSFSSLNGRHNMRIAPKSGVLSKDVTVTENRFVGGVDGGYQTWLSVQFARSSGTWDLNQHVENLLFDGNAVENCSTSIMIGADYVDVTIRNNILQPAGVALNIPFSTDVPAGFNGPRGVWVHDNTISNGGGAWYVNEAPDSTDVFVYSNTVNGEFIIGNPP